ncbi:MAG: hypothetical protein JO090_11355 [Rhizobacter sp.]|nr:hypothetical protein [Rhizobacter sp.]
MTSENVLSAVLTLSLMAGGAVAFGSELRQTHKAPASLEAAIVTLPTVTVVGRRSAADDAITLPAVTIVGRRFAPAEVAAAEPLVLPTVTVVGCRGGSTNVAAETQSVEQRVQ